MADSDKGSADYARSAHRSANGWQMIFATLRCVRPRLLPTLAVLVLVPSFISFGQWQWKKAADKQTLQALLDSRRAEPPVQMPLTDADPESLRYRQVVARGVYDERRQILIDNRIHHEQAGYHVLTPLRLEGSEMRVLVNRGWVPALADHSRWPQVATPAGVQEITGTAIVPGTRYLTLAPEAAAGSAWQTVWQNLNLARYRQAVDFPVQPVVIEMSPTSEAGGFVRQWPRPDERIERHLGYAYQWWGFAAATLIIWLVLTVREARQRLLAGSS
ncbi:MAG TPA: SURF1 family protein [Accumulibacter sp.]|nr:SURF1 family protein [Accumulibacter sp.]HMW18710.1 SURF1 family protein [Accumulibacter sp.]HMY06997.1 SURF1 family protein [Accumulibacter sp.]HNM76026.1 SURF1 family protein [Accumulibacter sp.]